MKNTKISGLIKNLFVIIIATVLLTIGYMNLPSEAKSDWDIQSKGYAPMNIDNYNLKKSGYKLNKKSNSYSFLKYNSTYYYYTGDAATGSGGTVNTYYYKDLGTAIYVYRIAGNYKNGTAGTGNNTKQLYSPYYSYVGRYEKAYPIYYIKYYLTSATLPNGSTRSADKSDSVAYKGSYTIWKKPTRDGYVFKGWTTNSNLTNDGYGWTNASGTWTYTTSYGVRGNSLVLYARWEEEPRVEYNISNKTKEYSLNKVVGDIASGSISASGMEKTITVGSKSSYTANGNWIYDNFSPRTSTEYLYCINHHAKLVFNGKYKYVDSYKLKANVAYILYQPNGTLTTSEYGARQKALWTIITDNGDDRNPGLDAAMDKLIDDGDYYAIFDKLSGDDLKADFDRSVETRIAEDGDNYKIGPIKVITGSAYTDSRFKDFVDLSLEVKDKSTGQEVKYTMEGKLKNESIVYITIPKNKISGNVAENLQIKVKYSYLKLDLSKARIDLYRYNTVDTSKKSSYQYLVIPRVSGEMKGSSSLPLEIEYNKFDLALRKSIVKIESTDKEGNAYNKFDDNSRLPNVDRTPLNDGESTANYNHAKNALLVEKDDIVTYTITVFNEGNLEGKVKEITDYLPEQLEFIEDNEINKQYGWVVSEDGRTIKTTYLKDRVLKSYEDKSKELDNDFVQVVCRVKRSAEKKITNIAEITKSIALVEGVEDKTIKDSDSTAKNFPDSKKNNDYAGNGLKPGTNYVKGQEDDDDFERLVLAEFDLALRKYITGITTDGVSVTYNQRDLDKIDLTKLKNATSTTAEYKHIKTPEKVSLGDLVTYTIRVYNEGDLNGYATKVTDFLPAQLEFVSSVVDGVDYKWVASEDGRTITTDYLADKLIGAFKGEKLAYKDLKVICRVKETDSMPDILTNIAEITEYKASGTNGDKIKDRDSEGANVKQLSGVTDATLPGYIGKDNKSNLSDSDYYYKGYQDDDDFEKLELQKINLSGKVFLDARVKTKTSSGDTDGIYTPNTGDKLLEGIKVTLLKDGEEYKNTLTDKDGKYEFTNIPAGYNYTVRIEYNGQNYEPTLFGADATNGSIASENKDERKAFNDKFATINEESGILSPITNTENYGPKLGDLNDNFKMYAYASTSENNYNTKKVYKTNGSSNVDFGIRERSPQDVAAVVDLASIVLTLNNQGRNYEQLYSYATKSQDAKYYEVTAREGDFYSNGYSRGIKEADYDTANLSATAYYVVNLLNQGAYSSKVNSLYTWIDDTYTFEGAYYVSGVRANSLQTIGDINSIFVDANRLNYTEVSGKKIDGKATYSIDTSKISLNRNTPECVLIKVTSKKDANNKLLLDNTDGRGVYAEVASYSSTFGSYISSAKDNDPNKKNYESSYYTGRIDRDSNPGNVTNKDNVKSEDDGDNAPYVKFSISNSQREINGNVWEDSRNVTVNNAVIGNGIRDDGERGIGNVTVELIEADTNQLAKVYNSSKKSWEDARVTTSNDGKYVITGYLPGDYYVRFTYDDGLTYKSTTYQANKVNTAFNVNNPDDLGVYTETPDNELYSDARDVYAKRLEVNKLLQPETNKKLSELNSANASAKQMQAKTGRMVVNIEKASNGTAVTGTKTLDYKYNNLDLGLQERAKAQLVVKKEIESIVVKLSNGEIQFNANPNEKTTNVTWINKDGEKIKVNDVYNGKLLKSNADIWSLFRTKINQLASLTMDKELMQGATINITYKITVKNIGEVEYDSKEFYYLGSAKGNTVNTTINTIIDYPGAALTESTKVQKGNLKFDSSLSQNNGWSILDDNEKQEFISEELRTGALKDYNTIIKYNFNKELTPAIENDDRSEVSTTLSLSSVISSSTDSDSLGFNNLVEIASVTNGVGRKMAYSTVGNQNPNEDPAEIDADDAVVTILPPFGQTNIYYYVAGGVLVILAAGIVIIKKKVLDK